MNQPSTSHTSRPMTIATSRWMDAVAFGWGFAEATFFFIVPDVLLTFSAMLCPVRSVRHLAGVVAGSLIGGAILFGFAAQNNVTARHWVAHVPFVRDAMFDRVNDDYERVGVWALCLGPMSGIPYKVYAVEAPPFCGFGAFITVSIPARLERLLITWSLFACVGLFARRRFAHASRALIGIFAVYWFFVYAFYFSTV